MAILSKTVILAPAVSRSAGNAERSSRHPAKGLWTQKKRVSKSRPPTGDRPEKLSLVLRSGQIKIKLKKILLGDVSGRDSPL